MLEIIKGIFYICLNKSDFKDLFVRMPLSKRKLRQFYKNAFNKTPLIKRLVVVLLDGSIQSGEVDCACKSINGLKSGSVNRTPTRSLHGREYNKSYSA
jgi:hypothetical protein